MASPSPSATETQTIAEKEPISEKDLNQKIMTLLKSRASCVDARSIMLERATGDATEDDWRIGHFDPGRGDRYRCKLALRSICAELRGQFSMVGFS